MKSKFAKTLLILIILGGIGYIAYYKKIIDFDRIIDKFKKTEIIEETDKNQEVEEKELKIVDLKSDTRPYAVVIDNVAGARPQSGLQKAYLVYEITVEGGLTRLLALFKDPDIKAIGPIRSARHYFLDYALENDAIFVHHGWSPQAQSDISSLKINNLNGLANPSNMFYRNSNKKSPHDSYTSSGKMITAATNKKYRLTTKNNLLLDYSIDALDLGDYNSSADANEVTITYSSSVKVKYKYDEKFKVYLRFTGTSKHIEELTNEQLKVKNIIIVKDVDVKNIAGDNKGRVNLSNIGSGDGYYISEGKAIKITWEKSSRSSKTIYKDENGKSLKVNDGNTFIQIQPTGKALSII